MSIFEVGKAPGPLFHIMVYDLAYINVPNINVMQDAVFRSKLRNFKEGLPGVKEEELLCPNKVIQTVKEIVCDADSLKMRSLTLKALDESIEFCVAKQCKDKSFPENIENLVLSRLYTHAIENSDNYSWHVFCSEIHDTKQAPVKDIHTSHEILMNDANNVKDPKTQVTTLSESNIHLRFYSKRVCQFKVKEVQKRLVVVVFHQAFEPASTLETLYRGGIYNAIPEWSAIFSLRGLSFIAFVCLVGLLMVNNTWCKEVLEAGKMAELEAPTTEQEMPEGVQLYEYE